MRISDWSSDVCSSDLPSCSRRSKAEPQTADVLLPPNSPSTASTPPAKCPKVLPMCPVQNVTYVSGRSAALRRGLARLIRSRGERIASHRSVRRCPLRSEEHTSELQSLMRISYAVFCLKKKKHTDAI